MAFLLYFISCCFHQWQCYFLPFVMVLCYGPPLLLFPGTLLSRHNLTRPTLNLLMSRNNFKDWLWMETKSESKLFPFLLIIFNLMISLWFMMMNITWFCQIDPSLIMCNLGCSFRIYPHLIVSNNRNFHHFGISISYNKFSRKLNIE